MPLRHVWHDATITAFKEILGEELDYHETAKRMSTELGDGPREPEWSLVRSLIYHPISKPELSDPGAQVYSPMIELADGRSHPEKVDAATEDTLAAWADAFEIFDGFPLVTARVADLLWLRRYGDSPYHYAQAAQNSLRGLRVYPGMHDLFRADCLTRALDIISEANIRREASQTIGELVAAATACLQGSEWSPGISMRLIERLAALPKRQRPPELDGLIQMAVDAYSGDPFVLDAVLQLRLKLIGSAPALRQACALDIIHLWRAAAADASPLVASHHIAQALAVARTEGLRSEIEELRIRLQQLSREDQGMTKLSAGIDVPAAEVEAYLARFLAGDEPSKWLLRFGAHCPVQEDRDVVARQVRDLMQQSPLQFLVTKVKLNDHGFPIKTIVGDEEHFNQAVIDYDSFGITVWGSLAAMLLDRMLADERVTARLIAEFLTQGVFEIGPAQGVARAFEHYAAERYEEALLCCIPRLEATLRTISMELGLVVYTEPIASSNLGAFKGLGDLLRGLISRVPEDHRKYLHLLLADPLSLNLRNRALHGLMQDISKIDAALVLHAATLLGLWRPHEG
jgi:hypothetical protein